MPVRKRLGQHFLHDPAVIQRLVELINPQPGERLVEIGPGLGALTLPLLERARSLTAVELDRDLAPRLQATCSGFGALRLILDDALRVDYPALADGGALRMVGNLPYQISSPLLFRLLGSGAPILDMHFMLQREVVERIVAAPGSRAYGRLSVAVAARAEATALLRVGAGAFSPPPKVASAVVRLRPRPPPFALHCWGCFDQLLRQAFSARRKTLRNAVASLLAEDAIAALQIDPRLRPERLHAADFAALANRLHQQAGGCRAR
ncbi:MAG: 16S rRNA (adenine(1518)-N(6)/adenine(1519)-N(6))-dimethyltransferase RsmA [Salinisphaera sp.]|nr:16S rRNA (adenine(1518)-N(6)/adenine(1519)-N(6))-dimethyltransferase RsmA [Salinisphaera sp.]